MLPEKEEFVKHKKVKYFKRCKYMYLKVVKPYNNVLCFRYNHFYFSKITYGNKKAFRRYLKFTDIA